MFADTLYVLRGLRRSPASAAAAIVTLSLTLGSASTIFALVDAIVLTPPPFTEPEALAAVGEIPLDAPVAAVRAASYATFAAWRERGARLATIEAYDGTNLTLTGLGPADRLTAVNVTLGFFDMLGVPPRLGRGFTPGDAGAAVVVISHGLWRDRLGADPAAIGRTLVLSGRAHTIVGVLAERFTFALAPADVWRPFPFTPGDGGDGYRVFAVARLGRNVTAPTLEAVLSDVSRNSSPAARADVRAFGAAAAGSATSTLAFLAAAAGLALFVAFTNLTGLLLVRGIDRRRELAVRAALGASRFEMARHSLLESLAIVVAGLGGGVLLALWLTPLAGRMALEQFGGTARAVTISWRVIGVVSLLAIVLAMGSALVPSLSAARRSVVDVLRRGVTAAPRELFLRRVLVTAEVALAFSLLVCMTLVGTSLVRTLGVNPGFDAAGVLALQVALPAGSYRDPASVASFYSALREAVETRLGAGTVAIVNEIPLTGDGGRRLLGAAPARRDVEAVVREASPAYFDVMRIPVIAGRSFEVRDDGRAAARAVISESLAKQLFGDTSALGRQVFAAANAPAIEVIGVTRDVKHRSLDERTVPTLYLPAAQSPSPSSIVVVRSARPEEDVLAVVREEVLRLDRDIPVYRTRPMTAVVSTSPGVPTRRVLTAAFVGFAVLALVLGAIGLFGVVAHDVARRRAELALRLALGAEPRRILAATLAQGSWMVAIGLAIGGVLSFWAARALGAVLFASELNAGTIAGVAMLLVSVAAAAVLPAALRAARTDPVMALRGE